MQEAGRGGGGVPVVGHRGGDAPRGRRQSAQVVVAVLGVTRGGEVAGDVGQGGAEFAGQFVAQQGLKVVERVEQLVPVRRALHAGNGRELLRGCVAGFVARLGAVGDRGVGEG